MDISEEKLEKRFLEAISKTKIYSPKHHLEVFSFYNRMCVRYGESRVSLSDLTKTLLEIDLLPGEAEIKWFIINESQRRGGLGRELYEATEQVLKDIGCNRILLYPFKEGRSFWPKMGFVPDTRRLLVKTI